MLVYGVTVFLFLQNLEFARNSRLRKSSEPHANMLTDNAVLSMLASSIVCSIANILSMLACMLSLLNITSWGCYEPDYSQHTFSPDDGAKSTYLEKHNSDCCIPFQIRKTLGPTIPMMKFDSVITFQYCVYQTPQVDKTQHQCVIIRVCFSDLL